MKKIYRAIGQREQEVTITVNKILEAVNQKGDY